MAAEADGVKMVGGGNRYRVNALAHFIEQFAVILVKFGLGVFFDLPGAMGAVHIAQRHDVFAVATIRIAGAFAAGANRRDVQFAVEVLSPHEGGDAKGHRTGGQGGGLDELAPIQLMGFTVWHNADDYKAAQQAASFFLDKLFAAGGMAQI